jgi:hypothetical protein
MKINKFKKLKHIIKEEVQKLQKSSPKLLKEDYCPGSEGTYHRWGVCADPLNIPMYESLGWTVDADNTVNNANTLICDCPGVVSCMCGYEMGWLEAYAQEWIYGDEPPPCMDNSGQLELQTTFYEAAGSPSVGDVIRGPVANPLAPVCMKYLGTTDDNLPYDDNPPFTWSVYAWDEFEAYGPVENLGPIDCNDPQCFPPPPVQHSCSSCGCVEDPAGPFSSLEECESGCSEDLESFASSLNQTVEQYCTKCSTNSYSPPMDEKCGCCEKAPDRELPPKDPDREADRELPPIDPVKDRMKKLAGIKPEEK